jgi:hypothetical protein
VARLDLAVAFVDWQNLRTSLACGGVTAAPPWVLRALARALRRVAEMDGRRLVHIELHLPPEGEPRADRYLLEQEPVGTPVLIHLAAKGRSTAASAITMGASRAVYRDRRAIILVSSDTAIAHLAAQCARGTGTSGVRLLHRRPRAARVSEAEQLGIAQWLDLEVGERLTPHSWTLWDLAAWRLSRLAMPTDDRIARALLRGASRQQQQERWASTGDFNADSRRLEQVDDLLATLWRFNHGQPFRRVVAEREALRRLGRPADTTDATSAIDALLVAQLLRHHHVDQLEVPSSWREGLLLPTRRIILRLARRKDHTDRLANLIKQHRSRFYSVPSSARTGQRRPADQLELHSSGDSWEWVRHALRHRLHAVEQGTTRRTPDGKAITTWRLTETKFTVRTIERAEHIRTELRKVRAGRRVETALAESGVTHPGRWLRCLRDAGLLTYRDGLWMLTEAGLQGFEHIGG